LLKPKLLAASLTLNIKHQQHQLSGLFAKQPR